MRRKVESVLEDRMRQASRAGSLIAPLFGLKSVTVLAQNCHIRAWSVAFVAVASCLCPCLPVRAVCVIRLILC